MPRFAPPGPSRKDWKRVLTVAAAVAVAVPLSACSLLSPNSGSADGDTTIELAMAPEPTWRWLEDQGILQEMEAESGFTIDLASSYDEFSIFAGGHADVVSSASYELPDLEEQSGVDATVFGKFNLDRTSLWVPADSDIQSICDLKGKRIVSWSPQGPTIIWGMLIKRQCDLDLEPNGGDFDLVVADVPSGPVLLAEGDADGCICVPEFGSKQMLAGQVRELMPAAAVVWQADPGSGGHLGPQTNTFVARTEWIDQNPDKVAFVLKVWQRAVDEWRQNYRQIINDYPQDFAANTPEEREWVANYIENTFDWYVDSVYLDEAWVQGEVRLFDAMRETGFMNPETPDPKFYMSSSE